MNSDHAIWSRPALAEQVLRRRRDGCAEVVLRLPALVTAHQVLRLEQQLLGTAGVQRVRVDAVSRRVRVTFDDALLPLRRLLEACNKVGHEATPLSQSCLDDSTRGELNNSLKRLLVAGIFTMQAMMFAFVLYIGVIDAVDELTTQLFRWLAMLSAAPVVGYAAMPFFRHAVAGLYARQPGIDVPIALAVLLIYAGSVLATLRGSGEVYFDSVSMFVFVLLLGRHLELRARFRHAALSTAAFDAAPLIARRRGANGELETVAAAELSPGDQVHVTEGELVPADGILESAHASMDTAMLSGESRATAHTRGDRVTAGSLVVVGPVAMRIEHIAADSTVARLRAFANAAAAPQDPRDASTVAARRFVLRVLTLTLATVAFWLWRDPTRAFDAAVAVLVVACPCAFALAAPATLTRALAVLARRGVLVARAAALQTLARVDYALFDKTGTLTEPLLDTEALRPHARACIDALRDAGLSLALVSGDKPARVQSVAKRLCVDDWSAGLSSGDKHARVCMERESGACVLFVGDGSNDAAALAAADVSATLPGGTELARSHADLLLAGGLDGLPLAHALAGRAVHILRQNRRWALAYNLCAIPFAALGFVPPWLAAIGMSLSSLAVVLNALRLRLPAPRSSMPATATPRLQERTA